MAKHGQTINLYLMDGDASGRYEAKLGNWNIITYKIPYGMVAESDELANIHTAGVYFLFSEQNGHRSVYVGESEDLLKRLTQHTPDRDGYDWYEAIVFVASDSSLDKGKIKYLENRFYNTINDAAAYQLLNRNEPRKSALSNSVRDSMEALIDNVKLVVPVIGQNPFDPSQHQKLAQVINEPHIDASDEGELIYLVNETQNIHAIARYYENKKVTLLSGSLINSRALPSLPESVVKLRADLESNRQLINFQLMTDLKFNSLSGAATFVCGHPASGPNLWRNIGGHKLVSEIDDRPGEKKQPPLVQNPNTPTLVYIKSEKRNVDAKGHQNDDGTFTVLKDSLISSDIMNSLSETLLRNREYFIEHGWIVDYQLQKDINFSSASAASSFVFGRLSSGPSSWKTEDGTNLGDLNN